ncbi:MAG: thiol peroxidase [Deltaproteobacteria bacterium]|nr:thiol peroxidase [Deltaproteobacteria bacterium]
MTEHPGAITMKGNPLTLVGKLPEVGQAAPDFEVLDNNLTPVRLSSFKGKICIITSVPSLDTPICDIETRRFNTEAAKLNADVVILTISMDLPFAQKRWCGASGIETVITLSDHRNAEFGAAFGMIIKELRLLARAVFVIDKNGIIRLVQLVKEVAQEPDYAAVLAAVKQLA